MAAATVHNLNQPHHDQPAVEHNFNWGAFAQEV